jgi:integrase
MNWAWLLAIAKRISAQAPRRPERLHLVTSERLYALGIELMDWAQAGARLAAPANAEALMYRDGLIIAFLALIPLRRRTLAALRIGTHLVRTGESWSLDIPAEDTKTRRALDYPLSAELSRRIDTYLSKFRRRIPATSSHDALWASNKGRGMDDGAIYDMVRKRTKAALGFPVNLHRFRHAAATLWSVQDPINVRGVKDLLGHSSFTTTERDYVASGSRLAGRALARVIDSRKQMRP